MVDSHKIFRYMLIFVPIAFVAEFALHDQPTLIFLAAALALVPLASLLGEGTEQLVVHTGPKIGGMIQATLGNAAELIIAFVALKAGNHELVKASITGSIMANILLVLGMSLLYGGLKHGLQTYDRGLTGMASTMMLLAITALIVPTLFEVLKQVSDPDVQLAVFHPKADDPQLNTISIGVAIVLIVIYALSMLYQLRGDARQAVQHTESPGKESEPVHAAKWSVRQSVSLLIGATIGIVFMSEFLVGTIEPVAKRLGVREFFLGVILVPIVGNVAENFVAVTAAGKNRLTLTMSIVFGSSMQVALFVAPLLVLTSLTFGTTLTLYFSLFEVALLSLSVVLAISISSDGESNWLEGAALLALWVIAALGCFFI